MDDHAGYVEKHVEFTEEGNEGEEEEGKEERDQIQQKLHRRDTPHHLKNKRVINKNNDPTVLDVRTFPVSQM